MLSRGELTSLDLGSHPGNGVGNGFQDGDPSKPTVDEVHGVERNSSKLDDGVVASGEEEQRNHVDDRHHTGTVAELCSRGGIALVPVNPPDAETNIGSKVAHQHEGLETAGQRADVEGSRELEFAVVTGAEQGSIQAVLAEGGEEAVGRCEVPLAVVVQTGQGPQVLGEVEDDLVEKEGAHEGNPDPAKIVHDVDVLADGNEVRGVATAASLGKRLHGDVGSRRVDSETSLWSQQCARH